MQGTMQRAPSTRTCLRASKHRSIARPVHATSTNGLASTNGNKTKPSPAETARTIIDICNEGTLSTINVDGSPVGTPVSFTLDKAGHPCIELVPGSLEHQNLARDQRCSLQVQPTTYPARAVASVTLVGRLQSSASQTSIPLQVDKCLYFGGLDQREAGVELNGAEVLAAEPDVLRNANAELIRNWNDERAEDIYRIVAEHLQIPLTEMGYAEVLWLDQLGLYARVEAEGHLPGPSVVRVPFIRPILDERDARSVLTMAAQLAWEKDRPYTPPVPSIFTDAAAAANN